MSLTAETPLKRLGLRLAALSPITLALAAALALHLAVNAMIAIVFQDKLLPKDLVDFLRISIWRGDSWIPMREAWVYLHGPHDPAKSVYEAIFFDQKLKFQYPLTSLFIYEPMAALFKDPATITMVLTGVSWLSLLLTPAPLWLLLREAVRAYAPDMACADKLEAAVQFVLVAGLTYSFYPLLTAYHLGQVQAWLNLMFAAMVWLWIKRRDAACAVLLALSCMVKPQLSVLLLWGALRGRWRFVVVAGACIGVGELIALALYGFTNNFEYTRVLSFLGTHGETFQPNQSLNGLLNRLYYPRMANVWEDHGFPPDNAVVRIGGMIAALAGLAGAMFARFGAGKRADPLDLAAAALFCTLASPVAWEHHYGVSVVCFVLLLPAVLAEGRPWKLAALAILFVLCGSHFEARTVVSAPLNLVQSLMFFGEIGLAYAVTVAPPWPRRGAAQAIPETAP